jgi:hypothetical protein
MGFMESGMNPRPNFPNRTSAHHVGQIEGGGYPQRTKGIFVWKWVGRVILVLSFAAVFLAPFLYIGNYAGDSQVHLVYAQNASQGKFFEFNPGEKSPGVTSPGYMLVIAAFFRTAPDAWVPAIVKGVNLLSWFAFLLLVFLSARILLRSNTWAWAATVVSGLLPGSVYNATIGMENGVFALLVFLWFYVALRAGWFSVSPDASRATLVGLGLGSLLGLACWFRPEAFVIAAVALAYRGVSSIWHRPTFTATMVSSAGFLTPFLVLAGGLVYFHFSQTGYLLPSSGLSRIWISSVSQDSYQLGPIFISSRFAVRLVEYFPLTALWLLAHWLFSNGQLPSSDSKRAIGFLIVLFWVTFILYSTVLGSLHLGRYTIFVMPALVLVGSAGAQWLWSSRLQIGGSAWRLAPRAVVIVLTIALGAVFLAETNLRLGLDSQASLWKTMKAPAERKTLSDALFDQLGQPKQVPISLALQEVQVRYWLDDRFVVRSLDGRVDPVLLRHATKGSVDHIGYLRERGVQILLDTPSYNRDPEQWSLARLSQLRPGEALTFAGLTFTRLSANEPVPSGAGRTGQYSWRWFAESDGLTVLRWFRQTLIRVEYGDT